MSIQKLLIEIYEDGIAERIKDEGCNYIRTCETLKLNTSYRVLKFKGREVELSQRLSDLGLK